MAELAEAFSKLGGLQNKNKLFCFYSKTPVKKMSEELLKNDNTSDYEWKEKNKIEFVETLNVEIPVSKEIQWELFSDEGYTDKGKILLENESRLDNRYLTFTIDPLKDGKNFFINLKSLKCINNNNREIVEDIYDIYNCFINLDKLVDMTDKNIVALE